MQPIKQTVRGERGNCFAACVASILELPIDALPDHFKEDGAVEARWVDEWNEFLRPFGLGLIYADAMFSRTPMGYAIAEMEVRDHHSNHAVVFLDGKVVHDPLGDDYADRFGRVVRWYVFTVLDPAIRRPWWSEILNERQRSVS